MGSTPSPSRLLHRRSIWSLAKDATTPNPRSANTTNLGRIRAPCQHPPAPLFVGRAIGYSAGMAQIQISDLHFTHGEGRGSVHALRGVSLDIPAGQFVAILGPSGAGKSSLLHAIAGLEALDRGRVFIGDTEISAFDEASLTVFRRTSIGLIFQFFNLLDDLTLRDNVAIPLLLDGQHESDIARLVDEAIDAVGLGARAGHFPSQLSGGEMQRAAVARTLAQRPAVILADEPTGNLDSQNGRAVLDLLRSACDDHHQTVLMVTHDEDAAATADRVVRMVDGEIVEDSLREPA